MKKIIAIFAFVALFSFLSCANEKNVRIIAEAEYKVEVEDFTDQEWKFLGEGPVIVDFYADWCPPCRKLAPVLEKVAGQYKGKATFLKVNVDNCPNLAKSYGIQSIPTLLFIKADGTYEFQVGFLDEEQLVEKLDPMIGKMACE